MPSVESDILQNEKQVIRKAGRTGRRERVCKIYVQRFSKRLGRGYSGERSRSCKRLARRKMEGRAGKPSEFEDKRDHV